MLLLYPRKAFSAEPILEWWRRKPIPNLFRLLTQGDARKASYLIRKTLREVNSKHYPQNVIQFMCENYSPKRVVEKSSNRLMYVASKDERILGTVSLKGNVISALFVNPNFHGKGIGTELMNYDESAARKRGYIGLILRGRP